MSSTTPIAVNGIYRHRTFSQLGNQTGENVRHFLVAAISGVAPTEGQFNTAMDAIIAGFQKPLMTSLASYIGTDIQNITGARPYPIATGTVANTGPGTSGAVPIPAQVSGIYTMTTNLTGRAQRGRSYIPFPSTADNAVGANGIPNAGYLAALTTLADFATGTTVVAAGGVNVTIDWGVYHHATFSLTLSTGFTARASWATQRRRGDYGRTNATPIP